jgi:glutaminase
LHVLTRANDVRTCVVAEYDVGHLKRRGRQAHEQKILEDRGAAIRVLELTGTLTFANVDYIARRVLRQDTKSFVILGMHRVPLITNAAAKMLAELMQEIARDGTRTILAGLRRESAIFKQISCHLADASSLRDCSILDEAIEWAEDQIIFRYGGFTQVAEVALAEQELLIGLSSGELEELAEICDTLNYHPGERIIAWNDPSDSIFFLQRGMVSVKLSDGVRVATLVPGTAFGELALIGVGRTANVWADNAVQCQRVPLDAFNDYRNRHPAAAERIMRNLAHLLAMRLVQANTKIDLLSAN